MANWDMYAGDTKVPTYTVVDSAGVAVSLAGATLHWAAANIAGALVLTKTPTVTLPNTVTITLAPADTATLPAGWYRWELEVIDFLGNVSTTQGDFTITAAVQ